MNIENLDLRHLRIFEALLRQKSVTGAANALDIPQPTISHALAKLRAVFNDPLLVRSGGRMEPTERALRIAPQIDDLLRLADAISAPEDGFDPAALDREFVIAGSDLGQSIALSLLRNAIAQTAPHVRLRGISLNKSELSGALERGEADLAFGAYPRLISGIFQQSLYEESYLSFAPPDHPFACDPTIDKYVAAKHVLVSTRGMAHAHREIEKELETGIGAENVALVTNSFLVGLFTARDAGLIVTAPGRFLASSGREMGLVALATPLPLGGFTVKQYWHGRNNHNPAHEWLRRKLHGAVHDRLQNANIE